MSLLLLAVGLTLLGSPQALHMGLQDPNFNENLISGKWFSVALASNNLHCVEEKGNMRFFIHDIQVKHKSLQFHHFQMKVWEEGSGQAPRINGKCVPVMMTARKTKKKFQYVMRHAGHNLVFLEKVDPKCFVIFCTHKQQHRKETVVVELYSRTPTASQNVWLIFRVLPKPRDQTYPCH
ncbi:uterocalin-like [Cynocephalus volans]|uniref:uterocalin-like n=1 Tax=Cynocephalus volans TaxID=110931 RepID=UPI002FCB110F